MTIISDLAQVALTAENTVLLAVGLIDTTIANTAVQHSDSEVSLQLAVRQFLGQFGGQLVQP